MVLFNDHVTSNNSRNYFINFVKNTVGNVEMKHKLKNMIKFIDKYFDMFLIEVVPRGRKFFSVIDD